MQASDGYLYGTTRLGGSNDKGAIFRIATDGTGSPSSTVSMATMDSDPQGQLVVGADGQLYGTTMLGGPADRGTIYRISLTGDFQQLYAFPALSAFNAMGLATNATAPIRARVCCWPRMAISTARPIRAAHTAAARCSARP